MKNVQLISPSRQREWGLLAVLNFILGGAGTGLYLVSYATIFFNNPFSKQHTTVPYDLLSLSIVVLGFLCVTVEAGRPFRGYYMFSRLGKSWISREVTAFLVFMLAVLLSHFFRHWFFNITAAVSALCFMIIQGFIIFSERAVTAWNTTFMPIIFLSSGLTSGTGVALIFSLWNKLLPTHTLAQLSLLCVIFNLAIWLLYLRWYRLNYLRSTTKWLELKSRFFKKFLIIAIGHITPILLLLLFWKIQAQHEAEKMLSDVLITVSSLTILIGVAVQKSWIVITAEYIGKVDLKY